MTSFTPFINWSFEFASHVTCPTYHVALDNVYSKPFKHAFVATLFTDANRTAVVPDVITVFQASIVNAILFISPAARTVIAPIIKQMILFYLTTHNTCRFPLRSPATMTAAFNNFLATNDTSVVMHVATTPVYINCDNFDAMLFTGISLTGPIRHIKIVGTGAGATTYVAAATQTPAQIAASATNQSLVLQQATTTVVIAATITATFNL